MTAKKTPLDLNHVSKNLKKEDKEFLTDMYRACHREWWCSMKMRKSYQLKNYALTALGAAIAGAGIGGTITLGPVGVAIFGGIIGVIGVAKKFDWEGKAKYTRMAEKKYKDLMLEIRTLLRKGAEFDKSSFLSRVDEIEKLMYGVCPDMSKTECVYAKKFH